MHTFPNFSAHGPPGLLRANVAQKTTKNRPVFDSLGHFGAKIPRMRSFGGIFEAVSVLIGVGRAGSFPAMGKPLWHSSILP